MSYRKNHMSENIKRAIIHVVARLNDPRISCNFIDMVKFNISDDLSFCTVFVSSIYGLDKAREAVSGLECASAKIKKELAKILDIRYMPKIKFVPTNSIEYGANMMEKINSLS